MNGGKIGKNLARWRHRIGWIVSGRHQPSLHFYTFHKTASSLFSRYVLGRVRFLRHVDVATEISTGRYRSDRGFSPTGYVYGPIRLTVSRESEVHEKLIVPTCSTSFVRTRRAVFFLRDPRDILVSAYYSFGGSHVLSPVPERRQRQLKRQREIGEQTIDQFVLAEAPALAEAFANFRRLRDAAGESVVLRYEDMIENWEGFEGQLRSILNLSEAVLSEIRRQTRPSEIENPQSHRRSGKVGGFRQKLAPETLPKLNSLLAVALEAGNYAP